MHRHGAIGGLIVSGMLACAPDAGGPVTPSEFATIDGTHASYLPCLLRNGPADVRPPHLLFQCGAIVTLYVPPLGGANSPPRQDVIDALSSAVQQWEPYLVGSGVPSLSVSAATAPEPYGIWVPVVFQNPTLNGPFCDETDVTPTSGVVTIKTACAGSNTGSLDMLFPHVVGHLYGFNSNAHKRSDVPPEVNTSCVTELPPDKNTLNSDICQHEIERLLAAYGAVRDGRESAPNFWMKPIITGFTIEPLPARVARGEQVQLRVASLIHDRQRYGLPSTSPVGNTTFTWAKESGEGFTVTTGGILTGVSEVSQGPRQAVVTINPVSVPGTMLLASAKMESEGRDSIFAVEVVQPSGIFRIDTVFTPPAPVRNEGDYPISMQVINPLNNYAKSRWVITYSDNNQVITTPWSVNLPNPRNLVVRPGSYTITIRAEANEYSSPGLFIIRSVTRTVFLPVCTEDDEGSGFAKAGGGISPNAVWGCEDGDIEF